jgi:ABC-type polysaccharide/polyol phosphate transport system ATPase subunit
LSAVIQAEGLGKCYRRGRERVNGRALLPGAWGSRVRGEQHWALRDLSFELQEGRSLGIIGGNGAGKSTLLKLVAGVVAPSQGTVEVRGRSTALIELGAGFHPDMTGRENVYFSAAVLGMSPSQLRGRIDDIVEFADIGAFLDTPVKRFSSGMLARLGFSVAVHVDADLIVLDEVLAVGDATFQRRCYERIASIRRAGGALLYVTHALWTVPLLCDDALLLQRGRVTARGAPHEVVRAYELAPGGSTAVAGSGNVRIHRVTTSATVIDPGESLDCEIDLEWHVPAPNGQLVVMLADGPNKSHGAVSATASVLPLQGPGRALVNLRLPNIPLQPGTYQVYVGFVVDRNTPVVDVIRSVPLDVRGDLVDPAYGALLLERAWTVQPLMAADSASEPG